MLGILRIGSSGLSFKNNVLAKMNDAGWFRTAHGGGNQNAQASSG
jgi:hypothetical protein